MDQLLVVVPCLPLAAFVINGLFRNRMSKTAVVSLAVGSVGLAFVASVLLFLRLLGMAPDQRIIHQTLFSWIPVGALRLDMAFLLDPLSAVMILVVSGVGFLIHVYSIGYMAHDEGIKRFFVYMNLFMFSMLTLILADNLVLLFVGWEGVGLCSYLLIGFWYHKDSAANAGKKAFIVNRIGDAGFLLGTFLIFWTAGTLRFTDLAASASTVFALGGGAVTAATLLLFVGATGKSAQIPLYVWLPDAMEGPTPVSALIHAATMVTAGVYLLARLNFLFILAPTTMLVVAIVGCATAIFAATIGLAQNDIKRVLAYSTVSQLGYMMMACGVAAFGAGIFHLMTHAFFKALLFLGAGSVIHALSDEQDLRHMGGLKQKLPKTYGTFLMATLAIAGIPIFSGFFSKDEILWQAFSSSHGHPVFWLIGVLTAALTAFYMFRLFYLTFYGQPRYDKHTADHLHESPRVMTTPLIILAVLSVIGGWIGWPKALFGGAWFEHFLAPVLGHGGEEAAAETAGHSAALEYGLMAITIGLVLLAIYAAYAIYNKNISRATSLRTSLAGLHKAVYNKYWVDEFYGAAVVRPVINGSLFLWKFFDVVIIDGLANGLAYLTGDASSMARRMQTGYLRGYLTAFMIGTVLVIGYLMVR